ncbi:MAG TPA: hypothetical protein VKV21_07590 [Solirubrobacteraceae bacterium]|nr:hypothetical protein [Solirubrobacteraceae bacterium]
MAFIVITFLYPLLLGALSAGAGLLVERCSRAALPSVLVPVVGFCALVVLAQFIVISGATAPATPWVVVFVAVLGFALGWGGLAERLRGLRWSRLWPLLAAVLVYLTVASPLIASGRLTFPGYLLDTTAGIHLATAAYVLQHGMHFPAPYHAYGAMLRAYDGSGYPDGGQILLGATGLLTGQSLVWMYFPFQVVALAIASLVLYHIARGAGLRPWAAAGSAWIAGVPALVTAYALMGSIKELTALPALLLIGSFIVDAERGALKERRAAIPLSVGGAAAIAAIGPAAAPWIVLLVIAAAIVAFLPGQARSFASGLRSSVRALRRASLVRGGGPMIVVGFCLFVVLIIPTLLRLHAALATAGSLSGSNKAAANDPGNLLRPLRFVQVFGVWLGPDHRLPAQYAYQTYLLIGVVIVAFAAGIWLLILKRTWSVLAWLLASLLVWWLLFERGTEWTDAKVMMLTSPVIVLVAMVGALGGLRRLGAVGLFLGFAVGVGVLASDALLYHGTNLAPAPRFEELASIGSRFAGQGPTLVTDFDEYAFFALPTLKIDGPSFAPDMRGINVVDGHVPVGYGLSYDPDNLTRDIQRYRLIVMRRSPRWSRPPGNFELVYDGRYYEVWRRSGPAPLAHQPLGAASDGFGSTTQPIARARCSVVHRLGDEARRHQAKLRYATRPAPVIANLTRASLAGIVGFGSDAESAPEIVFNGPARVVSRIVIPRTGMYQVWLEGNIGNRRVEVDLDGRPVGGVIDQLGGDGNMSEVATVRLTRGRHTVTLVRGGGSLAPGNGSPTYVDGIYLATELNTDERPITLDPSRWRSLCGHALDWIEVTY